MLGLSSIFLFNSFLHVFCNSTSANISDIENADSAANNLHVPARHAWPDLPNRLCIWYRQCRQWPTKKTLKTYWSQYWKAFCPSAPLSRPLTAHLKRTGPNRWVFNKSLIYLWYHTITAPDHHWESDNRWLWLLRRILPGDKHFLSQF